MDSAVEITKSSTVDPTKKEKSLSDFGFKKKSKKNKKSKNNNLSYMIKSDNLSSVDKAGNHEDTNRTSFNENCEQLKERLHNAQKPNGILLNGDSNHFTDFSEEFQCHSLNHRCAKDMNKVNVEDEDDEEDINSINSISKKCANKIPEYMQCGFVPEKFHNHLSMNVTSEFNKNNTEDLGTSTIIASTTTATHSNGSDMQMLKMTNITNNHLFNNNSILYHHNDLINNLCSNDLVDLKQKIDLLADNTEKLNINNDNIGGLIESENILCKYPEHDEDEEEEEELEEASKQNIESHTKIMHQVTNSNSTVTGDDCKDIEIVYKEYESELQMPDIIRLIQKDLSEPYSIYTYRYFIHNWPKLCFLAMDKDLCVGAIVCKLDLHHSSVKRGYIAMLAVDKTYRKMKIGTNLVQKAIQAMVLDNADEVVLETEITNTPALRLYENLGFVRDKRLFHYYLNGVDALRLKLWFR